MQLLSNYVFKSHRINHHYRTCLTELCWSDTMEVPPYAKGILCSLVQTDVSIATCPPQWQELPSGVLFPIACGSGPCFIPWLKEGIEREEASITLDLSINIHAEGIKDCCLWNSGQVLFTTGCRWDDVALENQIVIFFTQKWWTSTSHPRVWAMCPADRSRPRSHRVQWFPTTAAPVA